MVTLKKKRKDEFAKNRRKILDELGSLVLGDKKALGAVLKGEVCKKELTPEEQAKNRRKWQLMMSYSDQNDSEMDELCYMEFKKLYLMHEAEQQK